MRAALSHEDLFVVGCDDAMTDSMAYADVILPAATFLEYGDLYAAYGQAYLQRAEPVIAAVGESVNVVLIRINYWRNPILCRCMSLPIPRPRAWSTPNSSAT